MRQPGWDEPSDASGQTPWHTGLVEPGAVPGQPLPPAGWRPIPPAPRRRIWQPTRRECWVALLLVVVLAVIGLGLAVLWARVAPRLGFRVAAPGTFAQVGPAEEQNFATDGFFALLTLGVGLVAGVLSWRIRSVRGPLVLVGLAAGGVAGAVLTWRLGQALAPAPTDAELAEVGRIVYPALQLRATAALVIEPAVAVLTYLLCVGFAVRPDLGRPDGDPPPALPPPY